MFKCFNIYASLLNFEIHDKSFYALCLLLSTDVNDNVPFFTSSIYEASVTEGLEVGTLVLQVSANDLDLGLNGKVQYKAHDSSIQSGATVFLAYNSWMKTRKLITFLHKNNKPRK